MKTEIVLQFYPDAYETETEMVLAVVTSLTGFVGEHSFQLRYQLPLPGIGTVIAYDCVVESGVKDSEYSDGSEYSEDGKDTETLTLFHKE